MKTDRRKQGLKEWQKTIQGEIRHRVVTIVIVMSLILIFTASTMNYYSTIQTLQDVMSETAELSAEAISNRLMASENVVKEIGAIARLSNPDTETAAKKNIIDQKIAKYGVLGGGVIGADGIDIFTGENFAEKDFFKSAMKGETHISSPQLTEDKKQTQIYLSAPLWADGMFDTEVVGVVYLIPQELYMDDVVRDINVSANGSAYMLNKEGYTIAHKNHEQVVAMENTVLEAQGNKKLEKLASIEKAMAAGEAGFATYSYGGVSKFLAYAPIAGTDGWSIGVNAPVSDFTDSTISSIIVTLIVGLILVILAAYFSILLAKGIGTPIKLCTDRLKLLAEGDLMTPVPEVSREDECGKLAEATEHIVRNISTIIEDVNFVMTEIGEGNFNVRTKARENFVGDFTGILDAERKIVERLSKTIVGIREAANQVSMGSNQLAEGAQNLAEGATDQASSVEELLATVTDVTEQVVRNSEEAEQVGKNARVMGEGAKESTVQMERMRAAMERINEKSGQIVGVIQSIEEIAEETNLLALNASIEAARAGEAGRGFAVVANQIGNLAKQSTDAVDNTRRLIEDSRQEVEDGNRIVEITSQTLLDLINGLEKIVTEIEAVGSASMQQADMIRQINDGVEQISAVVEENSASAEESSATSEELSAQAANMNAMVEKFKIRE